MISNRDKSVTLGQIPVEADVCCNAPSAVDGVVGVALAVDGGLRLADGGKPLGPIIKGKDESFFFFNSINLMHHVLVPVFFQQRHSQG